MFVASNSIVNDNFDFKLKICQNIRSLNDVNNKLCVKNGEYVVVEKTETRYVDMKIDLTHMGTCLSFDFVLIQVVI